MGEREISTRRRRDKKCDKVTLGLQVVRDESTREESHSHTNTLTPWLASKIRGDGSTGKSTRAGEAPRNSGKAAADFALFGRLSQAVQTKPARAPCKTRAENTTQIRRFCPLARANNLAICTPLLIVRLAAGDEFGPLSSYPETNRMRGSGGALKKISSFREFR